MKIGYALTWDIRSDDPVVGKIRDQVSTWRALGHEAQVFCVSDGVEGDRPLIDGAHVSWRGDSSGILGKLGTARKALASQRAAIARFGPDLLYMRAQPYKPALATLMKRYPTFIEVNSLDLVEGKFYSRGYGLYLKALHHYNAATRGRLYRLARGLVSVTREMLADPSFARFGLPGHAAPNGTRLERYQVAPATEPGAKPTLVLLASGGHKSEKTHFQGVDKIIRLAEQTRGELDFLIVGNELVRESRPPDNVEVIDYVPQAQLASILARSDVGFGTVALYRKSMHEACSLKVRECLAYGLPVILGCEDTAFPVGDRPEWVLQLPNTPDNLDANAGAIVEFAKRMKGRRVSHDESRPYVDSVEIERRKLEFMREHLGG